MDSLQIRPLHQVMLPCLDLTLSVAFYRDTLGATILAEFPPGLAFFDLGGTRLLLERTDAPDPGEGALYFEVPDIEAACAALRQGGVALDSEPHHIHTDSSGTFGAGGVQEWMAFFRDPDGNVLALVERRTR